jgi:hypothetical protein
LATACSTEPGPAIERTAWQQLAAWAADSGLAEVDVRRAWCDAIHYTATRLIDALRRENPGFVTLEQEEDGLRILIGDGSRFEVRAEGSAFFPPLEIVPGSARAGLASIDEGKASAWTKAIIAGLQSAGIELPFETMRRDFVNSVANLAFNRLVARKAVESTVPEPAWQGNAYFPIPGLRETPEPGEFEQFCHLLPARESLVTGLCPGMMMHTSEGTGPPEWRPNWSPGQPMAAGLLPIHPWNIRHSATIRRLVDEGWLVPGTVGVRAQPLASLRTCRIADGGFDLKLSLDMVVTGERRLLFIGHVRNAPTISAYLQSQLERDFAGVMSFQADVASFSHAADGISPYLSVIVREPVVPADGERLYPAIDLWNGRCLAPTVFGIDSPSRAEDLMEQYATALLTGPVMAWLEIGAALEPHLQNVSVRVRGSSPVGVMLRDLDATVMTRGPHALAGAELDPVELGRNRLAHALHLAHLGTVANFLARRFGARYSVLEQAVMDSWHDIAARAGAAHAQEMHALIAARKTVKRNLSMSLARSMKTEFS